LDRATYGSTGSKGEGRPPATGWSADSGLRVEGPTLGAAPSVSRGVALRVGATPRACYTGSWSCRYLCRSRPRAWVGGPTGRVARNKGAAIAGRGNKGGGRGLSPVHCTEIRAEFITDIEEGQEGAAKVEMASNVGEVIFEATDHIQHQVAIGDGSPRSARSSAIDLNFRQ